MFLALLIIISAMAAQAQPFNRTFVSRTGSDTFACDIANPCATFAKALTNTNATGTIIALDTWGYGQVTINKAVTIEAVPGQYGLVKVQPSSAGITVAAGASDFVILRNLIVDGQGGGSTTGIQHNGGRLEIQDCKLLQLTTGISVVNAKANMTNTAVSGNTTGISVSGQGMDVSQQGTFATALLTILGGSVTWNSTAFVLTNPGTNPIFNVYLVGPSNNTWYTEIAQNTTFISGSGTGCSPCTPASLGTMNGTFGNAH